MKHIKFTIPISPTGQARGRAVSFRDCRHCKNRFACKYKDAKLKAHEIMPECLVRSRVHKDTKQSKKEAQLSAMLREHRPSAPFEGEIYLGVKAYFEIPKSKTKKFKTAAEAGEIRPQVKPDLSNIIKQIEDVMNGVFFADDKQIAGYLPGTGKYYGSPARWEVELLVRGN